MSSRHTYTYISYSKLKQLTSEHSVITVNIHGFALPPACMHTHIHAHMHTISGLPFALKWNHCTSHVFSGMLDYFSVFVIHWTLTGTTWSLKCICDFCLCMLIGELSFWSPTKHCFCQTWPECIFAELLAFVKPAQNLCSRNSWDGQELIVTCQLQHCVSCASLPETV